MAIVQNVIIVHFDLLNLRDCILLQIARDWETKYPGQINVEPGGFTALFDETSPCYAAYQELQKELPNDC